MERQEQEIHSVGVCEFVIYYKKDTTLWPAATLVGTIVSQPETKELSDTGLATIRTVLVSCSDNTSNDDAQAVRSSPDVTTIWANDVKAWIEVCGESRNGFIISKDSVLKVRGDLIFDEDGGKAKVKEGSVTARRVLVKKGVLQVIIGDNRKVIVTPKKDCQLAFDDGSQAKSSPDRSSPDSESPSKTRKAIASDGPPVPERLSQSRTTNSA